MQESIYMKMGNQSLESGKFYAAYRYFREEIRTHPNNQDALFKMGIAKFQLQEYAHALKYFKKVLKCNPHHKNAKVQIEKIHSIVNID